MNRTFAVVHAWFLWHTGPNASCVIRRRVADDTGQATTEYALMLLAAALVALMVVAWATAGGGAGKVGRLFDRVLDAVIDKL